MEYIKDRDIIIDSSIFGMGRIPGNLSTELFASYLNSSSNKEYDVEQIISLAYRYIEHFKSINPWGYNPIYMFSAILSIDRTYPEYFTEQNFSFTDNIELQKKIKKAGIGNKFNKVEADEIISQFRL